MFDPEFSFICQFPAESKNLFSIIQLRCLETVADKGIQHIILFCNFK